MDKSTGTPPSLEEKKALPNCGIKDGIIINVLKLYFRLFCNRFEVYEITLHICTSHWCASLASLFTGAKEAKFPYFSKGSTCRKE